MPMGNLWGEAADRLPRRRSEGEVRVLLGQQSGLPRDIEEGSLVGLGTQPPAATIAQHPVENHHPFDHATNRAKTTIAVVWLANGFVERSVVDVVEPSASDGTWLDGSRESAGYQPGYEFTAVLAANCAGELAVLALQKTSRVNHDGHQELTLSQRQTVLAQSRYPADADAVECSVGRIVVRHRNSSIPRGRGPERPPPREATT
jgi:hypothetical protein